LVHKTDDAAAFVVERLRWDEAGGFRGFRWDDIWARKARLEGKVAEVWRDKTRGSQVSKPFDVCRRSQLKGS
jgi:hypothetical protein